MYPKLFQITVVLFLAVVSVAVLGLAISVLMSTLSEELMAESGGIAISVGGLSDRKLGYIIVVTSLIVAAFFLFFRRRRFRR